MREQLVFLLCQRELISFRVIGHLHKERAAVFSGIDKNFTRTSVNEGDESCPKCRVGGKPTKLVEQRNKPVIFLTKSCGSIHDSLLMYRKNKEMIGNKILTNLQKCIQLYDKKNENDYLIVFSRGKNIPMEYCQITFNHYNFWHLLGCKVDEKNSSLIYDKCKNGEDVSKELSLVHSYSEANTKCEIFDKVFDFISNAKCIKIGCISGCPEEFYLTMALGNEVGIVGYDYPKGNQKFLIPKSVQNKRISLVSKELNKILFILSKSQKDESYNNIEYEIKKGVAKEYLSEISKDVKIDIIE